MYVCVCVCMYMYMYMVIFLVTMSFQMFVVILVAVFHAVTVHIVHVWHKKYHKSSQYDLCYILSLLKVL